MIPTLTTPRLKLREWRESDLDEMAATYSDGNYVRFIGGDRSRDESWRTMAVMAGHWVLRGYGPFVVESRESGDFVGYVGPWFPSGWPEPELLWTLAPGVQGRGFATEAAKAARAYVYDTLGWSTAISLIDPANAPSRRVAERLGARFEKEITLSFGRCGVYRHPPARSH